MEDGSRAAPLILTFVAVTAFVLLVLLGASEVGARRGDPLVILVIPELRPDDVCRDSFEVDAHYEQLSLNYRFQLAIKPHITLEDPAGNLHPARVEGNNLTLEIEAPMPGNWTLDVTVAATPGLATGIRNGEVFILGFPETPQGGSRPSICHRDIPTA